MHFRIVTKPNCPLSSRIKLLLTSGNHSFSEDVRSTNAEVEQFRKAGYRSLPKVFDGDRCIGGYGELVRYLAGNAVVDDEVDAFLSTP